MMERSFDMSEFEQSLKDHADQFVLVPSKRIWNGIYNNLHPGSKWPSITVALVLLITFITVGNLNNSPKKAQKGQITNSGIISGKSNNKITYLENGITSKKNESLTNFSKEIDNRNVLPKTNEETLIAQNSIAGRNSTNTNNKVAAGITQNSVINYSGHSISSFHKNILDQVENSTAEKAKGKKLFQSSFSIINFTDIGQEYLNSANTIHEDGFINLAPDQESTAINDQNEVADFQNNNEVNLEETLHSIKNDLVIPVFNLEKNRNTDQLYSLFIKSKGENRTGNAASLRRNKKNNKIEWIYYAAPMISNATFRGKGIDLPSNSYSPIVIYQTPSYNGMIYHPKLGFETGVKMTYSMTKKLKFVSGLNLNYSDYTIISNLLHPTFATLMFKDKSSGLPYSKNYVTFYGNGQSLNQIALTNYNFQASIPIGLQYQIWGNKKTQINIASTIEPSLILKSNSYIISADKRYYVNDPSLIRKINLGGNFSTFITFTARKVKWHIGPDIHYQLLSTYKNYYPIKEHLLDYGIRIGISK